ncbi:MerR family transcriptional regulator [Actinokineospora sp. NBRC 105648]|uniref:helix-turn-helix domain-containing protein n=1 Tax=Actinokineospora sp. NBRC 105648 TaxID=3032206 RepID=UPI0024A3C9BE|nr:MerR family transcriptional regulator [Actinokineospora sp. NBRC 105648]GLZ40733.1 MerR family transcriptional regulator [Actinokineospora sp. NBRC 105648]
MTPEENNEPRVPEAQTSAERFDDDDYPAYTMGRAAEMLGTTAGFLRSLDEANLIEPQRSAGGHRRYSRNQLRLAARVRELVDQGTGLDAACRIVTLEDQLQEARDTHRPQHPPGEPYPPLRGV